MPIDSKHKQYLAREGAWARCRDVLEGDEAIKQRGAQYIPMLTGMGTAEFQAYLQRALFYNATARTRSGLVGGIFRKPPTLTDWPTELEYLLGNVSLTGLSIDAFAKTLVEEILAVGRCGVIVDMPPLSDGEANPQALPYLRMFATENILNWHIEDAGGVPKLAFVVLKENSLVRGNEPFDLIEREQIRLLAMIEGVYTQQIYVKQENTDRSQTWAPLGSPIVPQRKGRPFDFIPFQFFSQTSLDADIERPPLLDLVEVNLSHYRTSADLEHGAHFTALPTPWVTGLSQDTTQSLRIGSGSAWVLPKDSTAGMLEYSGQGLQALEKQLERKERYMAVLGARLLEDQKAGVEAAATVQMRHGGENSVLASISDTAGRGLTNCLTWYLQWLGIEKPPSIVLNKEFLAANMSGPELTAHVAAWQSGAIGGQALFYNLKQGERLPDDMTFEAWREDVEQNGPTLAVMGATNPDDFAPDQEDDADPEDRPKGQDDEEDQ